MFFHLVVTTSATDLSSHLGRLPDRNLVTALHWDLMAVLLGNLLTVLNRFLDWDLIREWWYWWRRCRRWDSPVNKILLGPVHTGSRASELGSADSSARELSYIVFRIHRIRHDQRNKPKRFGYRKLKIVQSLLKKEKRTNLFVSGWTLLLVGSLVTGGALLLVTGGALEKR